MFLIIGIEEGRKEFEYIRNTICQSCGRFGRYIVFMTFTSLLLFFIPCFKWNKQYYVQMSCCGKLYKLNPEVGKRIAKGEDVEIRPEDLEPVGGGWPNYHNSSAETVKKRCFYCGFETEEDFDYCPKCGRKFS